MSLERPQIYRHVANLAAMEINSAHCLGSSQIGLFKGLLNGKHAFSRYP